MKKIFKGIGKAICYVLLMIGVQMLVTEIFTFIYSFMVGMETSVRGEELNLQAAWQQTMLWVSQKTDWIVIVYGLLTLLILFIFFKARKKNFRQEISMKSFAGKYILPLVLIGVFFNIFVSFVLDLLPIPESILASYEKSTSNLVGGQVGVMITATVIAAPIIEEVIFRGLALSRLKCAMPVPGAVILSSVFFGLVHGQLLWMAYAFVLGIILAVIAHKTDSILASMCVHMSFNLVGCFMDRVRISDVAATVVCISSLILTVALLWFVLKGENPQKLPNSTE